MHLHKLRPDVHVVIHNHARWSGIWANMHRVPPVYDQASAYVDGPLPLYDEYGGTFEDEDKSLAAAKALGDAKWALLANHGSLVVGRDLRQAHLRAITLEWRSMRAYEVEQAGGGVAAHRSTDRRDCAAGCEWLPLSVGGDGAARIARRSRHPGLVEAAVVMALQVRALDNVGVEVSGFDITRPIDEALAANW